MVKVKAICAVGFSVVFFNSLMTFLGIYQSLFFTFGFWVFLFYKPLGVLFARLKLTASLIRKPDL